MMINDQRLFKRIQVITVPPHISYDVQLVASTRHSSHLNELNNHGLPHIYISAMNHMRLCICLLSNYEVLMNWRMPQFRTDMKNQDNQKIRQSELISILIYISYCQISRDYTSSYDIFSFKIHIRDHNKSIISYIFYIGDMAT